MSARGSTSSLASDAAEAREQAAREQAQDSKDAARADELLKVMDDGNGKVIVGAEKLRGSLSDVVVHLNDMPAGHNQGHAAGVEAAKIIKKRVAYTDETDTMIYSFVLSLVKTFQAVIKQAEV